MTEETQEPGMGVGEPQEPSISQEEAQKMVDRLREWQKEAVEDDEILRHVVGCLVMKSAERQALIEGGEVGQEGFKKDIVDSEELIGFFSQLARGTSLLQAFRTPRTVGESYQLEIAHYCGTAFRAFRNDDHPEGKEMFDRLSLSTVKGSVEYEFNSIKKAYEAHFEGKPDKHERYQKRLRILEKAKEKALERATRLDEELGQK